MKKLVFIMASCLILSCNNESKHTAIQINREEISTSCLPCDSARMEIGWFEHEDTAMYFPGTNELPPGVWVRLDTAGRGVALDLDMEKYYTDTASLWQRMLENNKWTERPKTFCRLRKNFLAIAKEQINEGRQKHIEMLNKDLLVWVINHRSDTLLLPVQDGSLIALTEALDVDKAWRPISYWRFSTCGNSYFTLAIPPDKAIRFKTEIPKGTFKTFLRIKVEGQDFNFFYSDSIPCSIDYCRFKLDPKEINEESFLSCSPIDLAFTGLDKMKGIIWYESLKNPFKY